MPSPSSATLFRKAIDGIAVINLDERYDRWVELTEEAARVPELGSIERISAVRGSKLPDFGQKPWFRGRRTDARWAARAGCTLSHRKTLEHARRSGWNTMLVLEDDADLRALASIDLDRVHDLLFCQYPDWDLCYLGYSHSVGTSFAVGAQTDLLEVQGCYTTHAYLVKTRAMEWILNRLPTNENIWSWVSTHRAIDRWYARNLSRHLKVCAFAPALIPQRTTFSDIVNREVDYTTEFSGHRPSVTQSRTWFSLRKWLMNTAYVLMERYDALRGLRKRFNGF